MHPYVFGCMYGLYVDWFIATLQDYHMLWTLNFKQDHHEIPMAMTKMQKQALLGKEANLEEEWWSKKNEEWSYKV